MTLQRPTIVLFDMDGTIVRHINPWLLHILEKLDDLSHALTKLFSMVSRRKIERQPLVGFQHGKRRKLLVHRAMHKFRRKPVEEIVEPCPGIYDVLEFLQTRGVRMGLISNGLGTGYGHDILRKFDLADFFEVTIFREDIPRAKPWPDPILKATEGLKKPPKDKDIIWYIGDRHKDIKAAMAAEIHLPCDIQPIAYTLNAAIAILEHNVGNDHIIMAWPDLMTHLDKLFAEAKDV